ncbi:MAG: hypothetical protein LBE38_08850 [Deltaproteobacteria bacterium]|nr:hypothetical protein [Deltaproteobacteria bacterium]
MRSIVLAITLIAVFLVPSWGQAQQRCIVTCYGKTLSDIAGGKLKPGAPSDESISVDQKDAFDPHAAHQAAFTQQHHNHNSQTTSSQEPLHQHHSGASKKFPFADHTDTHQDTTKGPASQATCSVVICGQTPTFIFPQSPNPILNLDIRDKTQYLPNYLDDPLPSPFYRPPRHILS